jgi:hypothetical protein
MYATIPQVILHAIDFFQNFQKILPPYTELHARKTQVNG